MQKLIGSEVRVFLVGDILNNISNIFGILVDVDKESVYVKSFDNIKSEIFAIPLRNVAYCTSSDLPEESRKIIQNEEPANKQLVEEENEEIIERINVYVNKEHIASIPIHPTLKVHQWNEKIYRIVMGNPDVSSVLRGKVQKEIEYYPGEVYITTEQVDQPSQVVNSNNNENTFSMGGPATEYLNPSQMVSRLQNISKGNNNDKKNM